MPNHGDRIDELERFTQSIAADIQGIKADNQEIKAALQQSRQSQAEMQATLAHILTALPTINIGSSSAVPPAPPLLIPSSSSVVPPPPPNPKPITEPTPLFTTPPLRPAPSTNPPPTKLPFTTPLTKQPFPQAALPHSTFKQLQEKPVLSNTVLAKAPPLHHTKTPSPPSVTPLPLKPPDPIPSPLPFTLLGLPSPTTSASSDFTTSLTAQETRAMTADMMLNSIHCNSTEISQLKDIQAATSSKLDLPCTLLPSPTTYVQSASPQTGHSCPTHLHSPPSQKLISKSLADTTTSKMLQYLLKKPPPVTKSSTADQYNHISNPTSLPTHTAYTTEFLTWGDTIIHICLLQAAHFISSLHTPPRDTIAMASQYLSKL